MQSDILSADKWKPALLSSVPLSFAVHYIEKYLFSDWQFIGSLMVLIVLDTITGVAKHWKHGTVSSKGIGQVFLKIVLYGCVLIVTHTLVNFRVEGERNEVFGWIDTLMYSAIIAREAISILENVAAIYPDLLPVWILRRLKEFDDKGQFQQLQKPKDE